MVFKLLPALKSFVSQWIALQRVEICEEPRADSKFGCSRSLRSVTQWLKRPDAAVFCWYFDFISIHSNGIGRKVTCCATRMPAVSFARLRNNKLDTMLGFCLWPAQPIACHVTPEKFASCVWFERFEWDVISLPEKVKDRENSPLSYHDIDLERKHQLGSLYS